MPDEKLKAALESCPPFEWVTLREHRVRRSYVNDTYPDSNTWEVAPYGIGNLLWCLERLAA